MKTSTIERVTCAIPGPRNDQGKPKLIATIDSFGVWAWCRHCKTTHLISREQCIALWSKGDALVMCEESIQVL